MPQFVNFIAKDTHNLLELAITATPNLPNYLRNSLVYITCEFYYFGALLRS